MLLSRKLTFLVLLSAMTINCHQPPTPGSRFHFARLTLIAYTWTYQKPESHFSDYDSVLHLHINHLVQLDSTGFCHIADRDTFWNPLCFSQPSVPSSADSILAGLENFQLDSEYVNPDSTISIYDGPDYLLVLDRKDGTRSASQYSEWLPPMLRPTHRLLNSLAVHTKRDTIGPFDYREFADFIAHRDSLRVLYWPVKYERTISTSKDQE